MNKFFRVTKRSTFIGVSMCAAWAWGVSFLVTLTVLEDKGLVPFWIWITMNSLAIPLFGYVILKLPYLGKIVQNPIMKSVMVVITIFSIMINMQAVYEVGLIAGMSHMTSTIAAVIVGVFFCLLVMQDGLFRAMLTDNFQWYLALIGIALLIIMGMTNGETKPIPLGINKPDISWAFMAWILLFCGPFVDLQGWQRARLAIKEKEYASFNIAGFFFFLYMMLILLFAQFVQTASMGWIIYIVAFMVATSTMVANYAALQEVGTQKGFWIGITAVLLWPLLKEWGILTLWATMASYRAVIVFSMLFYAMYVQRKERGKIGEETIYR